MELEEKIKIEAQVIETLKNIYDPEIPVNIYDLGLIYEINITDAKEIQVVMTLTAPNCPIAESLPLEVKQKVEGIEGVGRVNVKMVFDPPWDPAKMTDAAKLDLGML